MKRCLQMCYQRYGLMDDEKDLLTELTAKIFDMRDDLKILTYKVAQLEVVLEDYIDKKEGRIRLE